MKQITFTNTEDAALAIQTIETAAIADSNLMDSIKVIDSDVYNVSDAAFELISEMLPYADIEVKEFTKFGYFWALVVGMEETVQSLDGLQPLGCDGEYSEEAHTILSTVVDDLDETAECDTWYDMMVAENQKVYAVKCNGTPSVDNVATVVEIEIHL